MAATGFGPANILIQTVRNKLPAYALYRRKDGEPIAALGSYVVGGKVYCWLMATDAISLPDMVFLRKQVDDGVQLLKAVHGLPEAEARASCWDLNFPHRDWLIRTGWEWNGAVSSAGEHDFMEYVYVQPTSPTGI